MHRRPQPHSLAIPLVQHHTLTSSWELTVSWRKDESFGYGLRSGKTLNTQMVKKEVLLKRHIWRERRSKMAWSKSIATPTTSSSWKDYFEMSLMITLKDRRYLLGSLPSIQVGWTFCKPWVTSLSWEHFCWVLCEQSLPSTQGRHVGMHLWMCLALQC